MQKRQQMNIGLCVITTLKYKQFFPQLLEGVKKYFLVHHKIKIFLFTDEFIPSFGNERVTIEQHPIESYRFPFASLYRYKIFSKYHRWLSEMDYIFYSDVDMNFCDTVDDNILNDGLTVVYHPGFYSQREKVGHWGSNGVSEKSLAWVDPKRRFGYVAGGFNGGIAESFLQMSAVLNNRIHADELNGVLAEYHDESHLNWYVKNNYLDSILYLTPEYCLVEQNVLREMWGISNLTPRIIAMAKDHKTIRE